ncbi:autophagy protein 17, partial [Ascosphaera atra]
KAKLDSENQRRRNEFDATLTELSSVEDLVKEAIDELGSVEVEKGFLATRNAREGEDGQDRTLVLRDFIEESNVEALRADIQHAIDSVTTAQRTLASSTEAFDTELKNVRKQLARHRRVVVNASGSVSLSCTSSSSSASSKHLRQTNASTSGPSLKVITELLHSLETKAEYLADLLQSLVRHYDLCVSAVRHTDGGWAAAKSIVGDLSTSSANDKPPQDHEDGPKVTRDNEACDESAPDELEPLSTSEYHQMLNVINADAPLAEDVTVEIHEHLAEMENTLAHPMINRGREHTFVNRAASGKPGRLRRRVWLMV